MKRLVVALLGALVGAGIGSVAGASLWAVVAAATFGLDGMPNVNWGRYVGAAIGAVACAVFAIRGDDPPKPRPPRPRPPADGSPS